MLFVLLVSLYLLRYCMQTRCHMKICRILMSEDLMTGDPNAMGEISEAHDDPRYRYLIQAAKVVPYKSKADVSHHSLNPSML